MQAVLGWPIWHRLTLRTVLVGGLLIRLVLVAYGEWQDRTFAVKFTDIDYHVFTDAAGHVAEGESPYRRPTYRYTPLLAYLLTPNHHLFVSFGKLIFVFCDILAGLLINSVLARRGVVYQWRVIACVVWLMNPLTATVSSRGNAESLLAVLVLACLYTLTTKRLTLSAILYGLAVHVKIFPIIYAPSLLLLLDSNYSGLRSRGWYFSKYLNPARLQFTLVSSLTFLAITALFYYWYGYEFLHETYLYHITRRDTRHNFSVYFYLLYLSQDSWLSLPLGILAFLPQAVLLLVASLRLYRDPFVCTFVQTFSFVTFNKVCTSQYFLWYISLLPLILPFSKLKIQEWVVMATLWFMGQGLWLAPAYFLEFQGYNTFILIWLAGLGFYTINIFILANIILSHDFTPLYSYGQLTQYPATDSCKNN